MDEGRFSRPTHRVCKECHEEWIETQKIGPETCGKCHAANDVKALPPAAESAPPADTSRKVFVHTGALTNRCLDCHGSFMDKKLGYVPDMTRAEKVKIRNQAHQWGLACTSCHAEMDPKTPPPNHRTNWTRLHGALGTQPDNACGTCHGAEACQTCHEVTKPASHNNLWREKVHGLQASFDRSRCLVCHRQDSCEACHEGNRPQSHNANWRRGHCWSCHDDSAAPNQCAVCHPGGNNVMLHQKYWPPSRHENKDPVKLSNCRSCHTTHR